ncbi:Ig-like domain-containing protein [Parasporobacterium paucivorans]|uniref:Ig-like domain (Group 2) n=1 Tax=Parasporobacterium paucivorans DSM 15970 TaxID=1122934 RepID=A0A1M6K680_9FIRM|nr:Ig-like domain-containing protein [Parasporobacterium paucivorans]SHJ54468.1 Ig-like domain (group 2) [Parasporobacterium paucivorans DSM 15970]
MKKKVLKRFTAAAIMALLLLGMLFSNLTTTDVFALDGVTVQTGQMGSPSLASYAGTGASLSDPYRIAVSPNAFTAPSGFWGPEVNGVENGCGVFAVSFEQYPMVSGKTAGNMISSSTFDLGNNGTSVWNGSWTYAFRFPTWTVFDTSTGDLRMAFPYKGNFDLYWTDWEYKFDAAGQTAGLSADKQIKAGDVVCITHYGNYIQGQSSRGTNYTVNFDAAIDYTGGIVLPGSGGTASPVVPMETPLDAVYYAVVDENGYASFSGDNAILYGGNYLVQKLSVSVNAENDVSAIDTKGGTLDLDAAVAPSAASQSVTWQIVNGQSLASIDENGILTAKADGQVTVRAASSAFDGVYGDYVITISNQADKVTVAPSGTTPSATASTPKTGDNPMTLLYAVLAAVAVGMGCFASRNIRRGFR